MSDKPDRFEDEHEIPLRPSASEIRRRAAMSYEETRSHWPRLERPIVWPVGAAIPIEK